MQPSSIEVQSAKSEALGDITIMSSSVRLHLFISCASVGTNTIMLGAIVVIILNGYKTSHGHKV